MLAAGPSVYYQLNETSGIVVHDYSNSRTDGSYMGSVHFGLPGIFGAGGSTAVQLNGAEGYVDSNGNAPGALGGAHDRTIELWFKTSTNSDANLFTITAASHAAALDIALVDNAGPGGCNSHTGAGIYVRFFDDDLHIPVADLSNSSWHYVAVTVSSASTVQVIVDGNQPSGYVWDGNCYGDLASQPFSMPSPIASTPMGFGIGKSGWAPGIMGDVARAAIYPTALNPSTLISHYQIATAAYQASLPKLADCYDEWAPATHTQPFIDSRPAADYCQRSLASAGYTARSVHNGDAEDPLQSLGVANVFYFAGHAIGACPGYQVNPQSNTAAALEMWSTVGNYDENAELSAVRGPMDSACLVLSGHPKVLDFSVNPGGLGNLDFVVLQACLTLHDNGQYESIGKQVVDAGAKTVLGFDGEIGFGGEYGLTGSAWGKPGVSYRPGADIWAHTFWASFTLPGERIDDAASRATADLVAKYGPLGDGDFGYGSVRILHKDGAPWTLHVH